MSATQRQHIKREKKKKTRRGRDRAAKKEETRPFLSFNSQSEDRGKNIDLKPIQSELLGLASVSIQTVETHVDKLMLPHI